MNKNFKTILRRRNRPFYIYLIISIIILVTFISVGVFLIIYNIIKITDQSIVYYLIGGLSIIFALAYSTIIILRGKQERDLPTEAIIYDTEANIFILVEKSGNQIIVEKDNFLSIEENINEKHIIHSKKGNSFWNTTTAIIRTKDGQNEYHLTYVYDIEKAKNKIDTILNEIKNNE